MKAFLITLAVLVWLVVGGVLVKIFFFPVRTAENLVNTAYGAQDRVLNADNAIYNYEWFKRQYQEIEASKKQYTNAVASYNEFVSGLPTDRSKWSFEDRGEQARLGAVKLGIQNNLESQIAEYNARASMTTRNIFINSVLPNYIDALTFIVK